MKGDPWNSHSWVVCRLEIRPGQPRIHYRCSRCSRDFTEDPISGERSAVYVSVFNFWKLPEPIVQRWLGELCPGTAPLADVEVRTQVMQANGKAHHARERQHAGPVTASHSAIRRRDASLK